MLRVAVLAAGASRRMRGADKLLEPVGGVPLLRVVVERALTLGAPVLVTLPAIADARRAALGGLDADFAPVTSAAEGMAASLRVAAGLAGDAEGLMIVLADMPDVTAGDLAAMAAAWRAAGGDRIIRAASADGRAGQPVIFPARLFGALGALTGDRGARGILDGEEVELVRLPDGHALVDLDTPEAWAEWRDRTGTPG